MHTPTMSKFPRTNARPPMLLTLSAALVACWPVAQDASAQAGSAVANRAGGAGLGNGTTLRSNEPVTLNFVNAEIEAVARAMSIMINRPIVVDPRVKAPITLYAERPIPVCEA